MDQTLLQKRAHRHTGAEHGIGILKDHLALAPDLTAVAPGQGRHVLPIQQDLPAGHVRQLGHHTDQCALAAAALPYDAQALSPVQHQIHVSDSVDGAVLAGRKGLADTLQFQDHIIHLFRSLSSSNSTMASSRSDVYASFGAPITASVGPHSTSFPFCMTAIRSEM